MSRINITIPAYNEDATLKDNVFKLVDFCNKNLPDEWFITIVNNKSTDRTAKIGRELTKQNPQRIKYIETIQKGKGLAIKTGWQSFSADFYIFMDADLATNLEALPRLITELKNGPDIVSGSRKLKDSQTQRSLSRKVISKGCDWLIKHLLSLKLTDFACGFKGINKKTKERILPLIQNQEWFFDTELLYLANQKGLKIKEIPVQWTEIPDKRRKSSLNIFSVSLK